VDPVAHAVRGRTKAWCIIRMRQFDQQHSLFDLLLRDHRFRAAHGNEPSSRPDYPELVATLRAHSCPLDPVWRTQVLVRTREVINRALEGLRT
jgi:hypothetical protein